MTLHQLNKKRMSRPKITYSQKYPKDQVTQGKDSVMDNVKRSKQIFVLEASKLSNGDEYLIYKVLL